MSRRPRRRRRRSLLLAPIAIVAAAVVVVALVTGGGGKATNRAAAGAGGNATIRPAKSANGVPQPSSPPRIVHGPHRDPVPILMYHVVSAPKPGAPYPELYTPEPVFAAQMRALAQHGYHGVTLGQVDDYWRRGYALPRRPIVVSFDDGYLSDYTHAMPVLRGLGWPGVLNLEVNNVRPGDLTAQQVRSLIAAGWEIDSHTVTHPDLTTLSDTALRDELVRSRAFIKSHFGVPVNFFCYPAGRFNSRVVAAVQAAGYRAATTTQPGLATPGSPFTLARIRVDGQDGVGGLISKLARPQTAQNSYAG
jgi:peptidoglycan/xylan/chitin deacetylase (PgdA/CDA1 family)